jgi:V/A-type H+-transporting ATPase subunit F
MSISNNSGQQYKIAIVGPTDMVSGFRALGVEAFDARTGAEALEELRRLKKLTTDPASTEKYAVVCVIEDLLTNIDQSEYAKVISGPLPAVIVLPGPEGSKGIAIKRLRALAEQAVGSAII